MTQSTRFAVTPLNRRWLLFIAVFVFVLSGSVPIYAVTDLLHRPAMKTGKAVSSMLTDVANTGTRLVAVGERGHILYSDDKGINWQQAEVPTSLTLTAVYFPSAQKGWAVGHDGVVLHSEDGGLNWTRQLDGMALIEAGLTLAKSLVAEKEAALAAADPENQTALSSELDALRFTMEDFQRSFDEKICCEPLMDVWFKNDMEGFVVGAYGQIGRTVDGGKTWQACWDRIDNPDRNHLNSICAGAKGSIFIAGEFGSIFRSLDEGAHFEKLSSSSYDGSFFGIVAYPNDPFVIAYGLGGNIVHSTDLGETWRHLETETGGTIGGATVCSDGTLIMVSYSGVILIGSGETATFTQQKVGAGWIGVADALDGNAVMVGMRGAQRLPIGDYKQGDK
ncbi:MAG: YCF48-related protein [Desulfobacterales bacterium]|jgi:photosystem II stability/assembly factor-like uncharacterized protein|nr:YCF48-related protein [Desulfobacterales bacterium]